MPMTMRDYSEKRDFHRMQVNSEIQITDSSGQHFKGVCRDLSGTGMQIWVSQPVGEDTELGTLLPSSSDNFPPFETTVKVLRCEPVDDGYLLGTTITEVKK
ncbi:PilZ domain-containing protein [Marinobacter caseinilyticus]|uniref:PilZ domain-containing protein n=1 Tax=Marinobacter caseinilyticus TaxID=2692195 RepID=UPI001F1F7729|nr:PilZ domain-containing protein [Marinobacter caseinilyticus]